MCLSPREKSLVFPVIASPRSFPVRNDINDFTTRRPSETLRLALSSGGFGYEAFHTGRMPLCLDAVFGCGDGLCSSFKDAAAALRLLVPTPVCEDTGSMWRFIGQRLVGAVPVLLGITVLVFLILHLMPGVRRNHCSSARMPPRSRLPSSTASSVSIDRSSCNQ